MCFVNGSIDQYTSTCPMCKAFKPISKRCPHKKDTCRNKTLHPRHDVLYFKNAEVPMFNGCGYCKWAQSNPPPHKLGMNNPGWPGCCRPPQPNEYGMISPAEWPTVSVVHKVDIPPEVKNLLASLLPPTMKATASQGPTSGNLRGSATPTYCERKSYGKGGTPTGSTRSSSIAIPQKRGSPQMKATSLGVGGSRHSTGHGASPGDGGSFPGADSSTRRTAVTADTPVKRIEGFRTTPPARKLSELEVGTSSHPPVSRTSLAAASLSTPTGSGSTNEQVQPSLKRRSSALSTGAPISNVTIRVTPKAPSTKSSPKAENSKMEGTKIESAKVESIRARNLEDGLKALSIASDASSDSASRSSGGSLNDSCTVTSDGFTDYLSDESEVELQRQAEIRAVQWEQNRMEEEEFKSARQQLTSVGLQPPRTWNGVTMQVAHQGSINAAVAGYSRSR